MIGPALDELSPPYVREARFDLTVALGPDKLLAPIRAFTSVVIDVSYARTAPEGVMLPILLEVQGPSAGSYQRREFLRAPPASIIFTPREGGPHLVTLREVAHNRWHGSLRLDVEGERLEPEKAV